MLTHAAALPMILFAIIRLSWREWMQQQAQWIIKMIEARRYAIQITRADGSKFLAYSGIGIGHAVFTTRRAALEHQRDLIAHGFTRTAVKRVIYVEPEVVE